MQSYMMGLATKMEEYVPTVTPMINENMNPRMASVPKKKMATNTRKVVMAVLMVRLSVLLIDALTFLRIPQLGCTPKYSRIRSKTTTVSLIEYPITVKIPAINDWPISRLKGRMP